MIRPFLAIALFSVFTSQVREADAFDDAARTSLLTKRGAIEASYRERLLELARRCEGQQLGEPARVLRGWLPVRDPTKIYIFKLSTAPQLGALAASEQAGMDVWRRFLELRRQQAEQLFELARLAHSAKNYALSYDLVRQACRENPDHIEARRILGYVKDDSGWVLPDAARRRRAGQDYHEKFGWLPSAHVERYQEGERFHFGKWISAADDEHLHSSIRSGWRIDSEHYLVTTNHSLEEGVRLSQQLEELCDVWRHVFVDYYTSAAAMQRWFGKSRAVVAPDASRSRSQASRPRHQVTHFRNRTEYNRVLRPMQPQIEITLGIYFARTRGAYFFASDEQYAGTLLHEATHQLFQESRQTSIDAGASDNFWAVEGLACFMESLVEHEHWYTLGGANQGRMPAARKRLLEDGFYVPLSELVQFGMNELQRDDRLPKIYSQISGQAWFFANANDGQYRRALVDYLAAIYTGTADASTLAKACGKSYAELDEEYHRVMRSMSDSPDVP